MFETEGFKAQLTQVISLEAFNNNLEEYETRIVDYLQHLASENEDVLMEREMRKAAHIQRGVNDALHSAIELTKDASRYAAAENRSVLRVSDIEKAYRARFCQFWPFCKQLSNEA